MIRYVVVDELIKEVVRIIYPPTNEELYAEEAIEIMKSDPDYNPKREALYLRVGQQEDNGWM